jgi:hypothetical protein
MHKRYVIMTFARGEYFDGTYKQLNAPPRETRTRLQHVSTERISSYAYMVIPQASGKLTLNG